MTPAMRSDASALLSMPSDFLAVRNTPAVPHSARMEPQNMALSGEQESLVRVDKQEGEVDGRLCAAGAAMSGDTCPCASGSPCAGAEARELGKLPLVGHIGM